MSEESFKDNLGFLLEPAMGDPPQGEVRVEERGRKRERGESYSVEKKGRKRIGRGDLSSVRGQKCSPLSLFTVSEEEGAGYSLVMFWERALNGGALCYIISMILSIGPKG